MFFPGQGLLKVSGHAAGPPGRSVMLWIQVRDAHAAHARLAAAGVPVVREPVAEPWGLIQMWVQDPTASGSSWPRFPPVTLSAVIEESLFTMNPASWPLKRRSFATMAWNELGTGSVVPGWS